jgi:hypothetical protein
MLGVVSNESSGTATLVPTGSVIPDPMAGSAGTRGQRGSSPRLVTTSFEPVTVQYRDNHSRPDAPELVRLLNCPSSWSVGRRDPKQTPRQGASVRIESVRVGELRMLFLGSKLPEEHLVPSCAGR